MGNLLLLAAADEAQLLGGRPGVRGKSTSGTECRCRLRGGGHAERHSGEHHVVGILEFFELDS